VITGGVGPYTVEYEVNGGTPVVVNNYDSGDPISTGLLLSGTYTYTLVDVTDANGCPSLSNTGSAVVNVGTTLASATLSGGGPVCLDLPAELTLTISGGVPPYTVDVDNGIGTIFGYQSGDPIPVPTNAVGTVSYDVTSITDDCGATLAGVTNSPQQVTVNPLPTVVDQTPVACSDDEGGNTATVDLTTLEASINATATITWYESYDAGTKTFNNPIATPTAYVVTDGVPVFARVEDGNTCVSPATATYTVQPKAEITVQPADQAGCDLGDVVVSVTAVSN